MRVLYTNNSQVLECDRLGVAQGDNIKNYLCVMLLEHKKGEMQPASESIAVGKERCLLQAPMFAVVEGIVAVADEDVDDREPGMQITSPCDSVTVSEVQFGVRGLTLICAAGGVYDFPKL